MTWYAAEILATCNPLLLEAVKGDPALEVYCQWWTLPFQAASACLPKFSANLAGDS